VRFHVQGRRPREHAETLALMAEAERVCSLLESDPESWEEWAFELRRGLTGLQHFALSVPMFLGVPDVPPKADVETPEISSARAAEVSRRVERALGPRIHYAFVLEERFEPDHVQLLPGLLSLDLAEIYRQVQPYLELWRRGSPAADLAAVSGVSAITFDIWNRVTARALFALTLFA
jgi:hypothetical protein